MPQVRNAYRADPQSSPRVAIQQEQAGKQFLLDVLSRSQVSTSEVHVKTADFYRASKKL